jgi:hypothetical protein
MCVRRSRPVAVRGGQPGAVAGHRRAGADSAEVREWANAQGIDVKDRGRVPADLVARFKASTLK